MLRALLLISLWAVANAAFEGDTCVENGVTGICINIKNCRSALQNVAQKKRPQICSFDKEAPIVCCLDNRVPGPLTTSTKRPYETTSDYVPPTYDYETNDPDEKKCDPVDPKLTTAKTGQKSWDKCLEYQEKLVYPCEKSTALIGGYQRKFYCYHNADELIVGGENASRNEFPHMVLLGYGNDITAVSWECGGTLVSEKFVLTAGHCVVHPSLGDIAYASLGVLARSEVTPSNIYKIKNRFRHPKYRNVVYNDIALLELEREVKLDPFTVPACLHIGDRVNDERASATGWGLLGSHDSIPDILQKVTVNKIPTPECQKTYPKGRLVTHSFDRKTQLCYGDKDEPKDTCKGDSGGPLQIKHKKINCMYLVIGVTSGGRGCAWRGMPGLYSKVAHHLDWIESIVWA